MQYKQHYVNLNLLKPGRQTNDQNIFTRDAHKSEEFVHKKSDFYLKFHPFRFYEQTQG